MGKHLRATRTQVSVVLCSSAKRALQTLERVGPSGEVHIEPELYIASADGLLGRLHRVPEEVDAVMLIGHNPAIQDLAVGLSGPATNIAGDKFPTGALATLRFSGGWRELEWGRAELVQFVTPKELA